MLYQLLSTAFCFCCGVSVSGTQNRTSGSQNENALRHHADDRERFPAEGDVAADDRGVARVEPLPQGVAENHALLGAGLAFLFGERAAERRPDAEHAE